jgi:hypothetical protein
MGALLAALNSVRSDMLVYNIREIDMVRVSEFES